MKWISVEKEMPEVRRDVLLWCGWNITGFYGNDGQFYTEDKQNVVHMVTHWMPLPEPPEATNDM
jgi:hypothetical protein